MYYQEHEGRIQLENTNANGRQVAEWKFRSPFKTFRENDKAGPVYTVKISLHVEGGRAEFRAHGDGLNKNERLRHTDIEQLRLMVEEALTLQHRMDTGVTWEDWLEVEVKGQYEDRHGGRFSSSLEITYRRLKRGVDPDTGIAYTINSNNIAVPFPQAKTYRPAETDEERMFGETAVELSYIPATPENIAALENLMGRTQQLRDALSQFLSQENVKTALAEINSRPALPFTL